MSKLSTYSTVSAQLALAIGVASLWFVAVPVSAAELQPYMPEQLPVGSTIVVPIILDAQGESINAVEGFLHYAPSLTLTEIRDGNSIVSFWVERPSIERGLVEDSFVHFSGIIPGGFAGSGEIFSLVFTVTTDEPHTFSLSAARALRNDGVGTETTLTIGGTRTAPRGTPSALSPQQDTTPPDTFTATVSSDPNLYDGKHVLVFATQDKGSGIDYYEVAERRGFKTLSFGTLTYTRATSPYVLADQDLRSYIYVKAVDRSGNVRAITLSPVNLPLYYNLDVVAFILILLVGLGAILLRRHRYAFRK